MTATINFQSTAAPAAYPDGSNASVVCDSRGDRFVADLVAVENHVDPVIGPVSTRSAAHS